MNSQSNLAKSSSLNSFSQSYRGTSTPDVSNISTALSAADQFPVQSDNGQPLSWSRSISLEGVSHDNGSTGQCERSENNNKSTPRHIEPLNICPDDDDKCETFAEDMKESCGEITGPCASSSTEAFISHSRIGSIVCVEEDNIEKQIESVNSPSRSPNNLTRLEEADSTVIHFSPSSPEHETCAADSSSHSRENKQSEEKLMDFMLNNNEMSIGKTQDETEEEVAPVEKEAGVFPEQLNVGHTLQYVGSFSMPGEDSTILHKLAENFAKYKQKPFVFLDSATTDQFPEVSTEEL